MKLDDAASIIRPGLASAVQHALFWLVLGNAIGVMIAILLLFPALNPWLAEWTYGRWMMVHMNILLYGWCALPMLGFLFNVYRVETGILAAWARPVIWLWSAVLVAGSWSWLQGQSSGKLFLDWSGMPRAFLPLTMSVLWVLLAASLVRSESRAVTSRAGAISRWLGLAVLGLVPLALVFATSPGVYAAVNPDTGGPTGASQLESTLGVVLILLLTPLGVARKHGEPRLRWICWLVLVAQLLFCLALGRANVSHRAPVQFLGLGSALLWIPLVPSYFATFEWHAGARRWKTTLLWWWALLVSTGWIVFLPGVLDRSKFTDILVGHSLVAVAGFLSALLILVMIQLIGEEHAWIFNRTWSFLAWNYGVLAYVVVMLIAGCFEAADPAFTIVPGPARNLLYAMRLITGLMMLAGSFEWFVASLSLNSESRRAHTEPARVIAA